MRSKGKLSVPQSYIISSKVESEIPTGYYVQYDIPEICTMITIYIGFEIVVGVLVSFT